MNDGLLNKISNKIGITRNEVFIVLILACGLLIGVIYRYSIGYEKISDVHTSDIIEQKLDSLDIASNLKPIDKINNTRDSSNVGINTTDISSYKLSKPKYVGTININTATKTELMKLERIGPKIAEAIIEYRENKPFRRIEEIMFVKGIGDKTFKNIKKNIKV